MKRKKKIILIVSSLLFVVLLSGGGYLLWRVFPPVLNSNPVVMDLPFKEYNHIDAIQGFGDLGYQFHNGIDYGINASTKFYAWCKLRVTGIRTWFNEKGGHWQTNIQFAYSWKYSFECAFESWALNETYALLQEAALPVKIGQVLEKGDFIGTLMNYGDSAHVHFGIKENHQDVCPYLFLSPSAKIIFDQLFAKVAYTTNPCN